MLKRSPLRRATPLKRSRKRLRIRVRKRDLEWARAVKERDGHICRYCRAYARFGGENTPSPKPHGLQAAHIFGRSRKSVRYDLDNGISLCTAHHFHMHAHPIDMMEFAKLILGEAKFDALRARAMGIKNLAGVEGERPDTSGRPLSELSPARQILGGR